MNDLGGYQSPFAKPLYTVPSADFSAILTVVFLFIFLFWLAYTFVAAYHWFRYGGAFMARHPGHRGAYLRVGPAYILHRRRRPLIWENSS